MAKFFREKSQIVVLSTFDQREFKKINYFDENVYSVRERVKNALFRTLYKFLSKYIYFFLINIDQKYSKQQFEIFP